MKKLLDQISDWLKINSTIKLRKLNQNITHRIFNVNFADSKKTWLGVNSFVSNKETTSLHEILINDVTIKDPIDISNDFNNYLTNVGPKLE